MQSHFSSFEGSNYHGFAVGTHDAPIAGRRMRDGFFARRQRDPSHRGGRATLLCAVLLGAAFGYAAADLTTSARMRDSGSTLVAQHAQTLAARQTPQSERGGEARASRPEVAPLVSAPTPVDTPRLSGPPLGRADVVAIDAAPPRAASVRPHGRAVAPAKAARRLAARRRATRELACNRQPHHSGIARCGAERLSIARRLDLAFAKAFPARADDPDTLAPPY
jgi:hypothetical protein